MINRKILILICCAVFALSANAKKSPISLTTKSYQEVVEVDSSGKKVVKLVDAKKVLPGDIIVYKNTIENSSQKPAKNMVLNNPIPEHMEYVANSANCSDGCKILYSVDGGNSFDVPSKLMIKVGNKSRLALPKEYTNVRWILISALNPNSVTDVSFKARLK